MRKGRSQVWLPSLLGGLLAALVLVVGAGTGCGGPASGETAGTQGVLNQGSASSLSAEPPQSVSTSTTAPGDPVLGQLPAVSLDDLALVRVQSGQLADGRTPYGYPVRVLSPSGDADTVKRLLAAYAGTKLKPDQGFPILQNVTVYLDFVMKNGSYVDVHVGREPDALALGYWAKGLAQGGSASPRAYASSPELVSLAQSLVTAASPDSFVDFTLPAVMPPDFGFVLAYDPLAEDVADTFSGTFTKNLLRNPAGPSATVQVELSSEDMTKIYETLASMDIAHYPAQYKPTGRWSLALQTYYFRLRVGGREKEIHWVDGEDSSTPDAVALRHLFEQIRAAIEATPEYRSLPPIVGGYS
jgi:hypothetical protein